MKRPAITLLALFLCFAFSANAFAEIELKTPESRIAFVTVLPNRAEIIRAAEVNLDEGLNKILIKPFEPGTDRNSLRIKASAAFATDIYAINIAYIPVPLPPIERYKELVAGILTLSDEITDLNDTVAVLGIKSSLASKLLDHTKNIIRLRLSLGKGIAEDLAEKIAFLSETQVELGNSINDLKKQIVEKKKQLEALKRELLVTFGRQRKRELGVIVELNASAAGTVSLEMKYFVNNVSWSPQYEFTLLKGSNEVEIRYYAEVAQSTGFNWEDIPLTLSTSAPTLALAPPKPGAWSVAFYEPPPAPKPAAMDRKRGARRKVAEKAKSMKDALEEAEMELEEDAEAFEPKARAVKEGGLAVSFRIPEKHSIQSGSTMKFLVTVLKLPAQVKQYCVPCVDETVYLRAVMVNKTEFPLLPGVGRCFIEELLTGYTAIKRIVEGGELKLPIGIEQRLKVEYKILENKKDERGKKMRHYFKFRIEVTNNSNEEMEIELKDRIPVSQDDDLKVKDIEYTVKPDEKNPEGILTWRLKVAPKSKRVIEFGYYVEYPKDSLPVAE